ncbi:MAG TPA: hypothetical protein VNI84_01040 [Pyrinomonadaceae bacterium]|nr:hypothetical protein [Pyrinomonadaceae bacterium]
MEAEGGRVKEGLEKLRRSLEMREAALRQDPSMTLARRYAAISRNKIGRVLLKNKNTEAALTEFRQALEANRDLSGKDAINLDLARELADSYANTAAALFALARTGSANQAESLRREAREMNQNALNIFLRMKERNTFFGADAPRLERLSRDTARIE